MPRATSKYKSTTCPLHVTVWLKGPRGADLDRVVAEFPRHENTTMQKQLWLQRTVALHSQLGDKEEADAVLAVALAAMRKGRVKMKSGTLF